MLVSWLLSSFSNQHNICERVSQRDLRLVAVQFCTHLLAANVIRKLEEESTTASTSIFKVCELLINVIRKCVVNNVLYTVYMWECLCLMLLIYPTIQTLMTSHICSVENVLHGFIQYFWQWIGYCVYRLGNQLPYTTLAGTGGSNVGECSTLSQAS